MRCSLPRRGTQHAIHPNGTNHRRVPRLDVVARVRRLCETGLLKERPQWLEWCERVPPLENHSLNFQARSIRNPYPQMVNFLLKKYPDLRFQDCYVDGNDWSAGNDTFRDDHPVMQFVARQLEIMRTEGVSKKEAFKRTEELFRERREHLEREQKVMMAFSMEDGLHPMFTTGRAYLEAEQSNAEAAQLNIIRKELRKMRIAAQSRMEEENKTAQATAIGEQAAEQAEAPKPQRPLRELRAEERSGLREEDDQRRQLVGKVLQQEPEPQEVQTSVRQPDKEDSEPVKFDSRKEEPDEMPREDPEAEVARRMSEPERELAPPQQQAPPQRPPQLDDGPQVLVTPRRKSADELGSMIGSGVLGEGQDEPDFAPRGTRKARRSTGKEKSKKTFGGDDDDF